MTFLPRTHPSELEGWNADTDGLVESDGREELQDVEEIVYRLVQTHDADDRLVAEEEEGQLTPEVWRRASRPWTYLDEPYLYGDASSVEALDDGGRRRTLIFTRRPNDADHRAVAPTPPKVAQERGSAEGSARAGGSTPTSSASGVTTSPAAATSTSSTSSSASSASGGGEGGAGEAGAAGDGGAGGAAVDPAECAAQLTEEECYAAGCNAWLSYFELTVVLDQCQSENVGPLCMHYTNGGPTAWGAFARLFDADIPRVLGDSSLAVPDGWVHCGEPGSEGLRECCCYGNLFTDDTCAGVQSDLP